MIKEATAVEFEKKINEILEGMDGWVGVVENLTPEQKQELLANPTTAFGGLPYAQAFELMTNLRKYTTGNIPPETKQYLSYAKDNIQLELVTFGATLRQTFGAQLYEKEMAPILSSLDDFGSYFVAPDQQEAGTQAAAEAESSITPAAVPEPETATSASVASAEAAPATRISGDDFTASKPATSTTTQSSPKTSEEEVFSRYMAGSYNPSSSMDRGKMDVIKNMMAEYEGKYGKPFDTDNREDLSRMQSIANNAYRSKEYRAAAGKGSIPYRPKRPPNKPEPKGSTLYKTREGGFLGIGAKDKFSPEPPPVGTQKYQAIDAKTGKVTQVRRAKPVKTINTPKPGALRNKNK